MQKYESPIDTATPKAVSKKIDSLTLHEGEQKRDITRRSFLKSGAAVAGIAALGSSFSLIGCTSNSNAGEQPGLDGEETTGWGRCYHGGCFACRYMVTVRDGVVAKIAPDPDAPFGRRPCLRGYAQIQRLYATDRIRYPMKRVGERGENEWEQITWDEAIETIAAEFGKLLAENDSHCIASYGGSPGARLGSLSSSRLAMILELTTFDMSADWALYQGLHQVYGAASASTMSSPGNEPFEDDIINAKRIFLWGNNLTESYLQRWRFVKQAQRNGAELISIDPNETTTGVRSDKWYRLRPATDTALILAMCNAIIEEDLQDSDYLKEWTVAPYLVKDSDGAFLRMSDLGVEPEEGPVDMMTGMPTLIDPQVFWDEDTNAAVAAGTEGAKPSLTGSYETNGIKVTTAYDLFVKHVEDYTPESMADITEMSPDDIRDLARMAADGPVTHMFGLGLQAYQNGLQYGVALGTLLAITGQTGKPGAGIGATAYDFPMNAMWLFPTFTFANSISVLDVPEVIKTGQWNGNPYPPIKALLVNGGGLVGSVVNMNRMVDEVFKKLDFIVCVDVAFSDTARWADIVLPGNLCFESEDIYISPLNYSVQYWPKLIEPLYECKTTGEITRLIGTALGMGELFSYTDEEALRELLTVEPLISMGIDLDSLRKEGDMRYAPPSLAGASGSYPTASGKVEFYVENMSARLGNVTGATVDPSENHFAHFYPPLEAWPESEAQKKHPFILTSVRSRNRWHTSNFNVPWLNELDPEPTLFINPDDAKSNDLENGGYVEVYNDRGAAVAKVSVSSGMRPGMLAYPKGWQSHQYKSGNFGTLTHAEYDPLAMNASFFDCAVSIRKWEE